MKVEFNDFLGTGNLKNISMINSNFLLQFQFAFINQLQIWFLQCFKKNVNSPKTQSRQVVNIVVVWKLNWLMFNKTAYDDII